MYAIKGTAENLNRIIKFKVVKKMNEPLEIFTDADCIGIIGDIEELLEHSYVDLAIALTGGYSVDPNDEKYIRSLLFVIDKMLKDLHSAQILH